MCRAGRLVGIAVAQSRTTSVDRGRADAAPAAPSERRARLGLDNFQGKRPPTPSPARESTTVFGSETDGLHSSFNLGGAVHGGHGGTPCFLFPGQRSPGGSRTSVYNRDRLACCSRSTMYSTCTSRGRLRWSSLRTASSGFSAWPTTTAHYYLIVESKIQPSAERAQHQAVREEHHQ